MDQTHVLEQVLGERTGTSGGREHGIGYSRIRGFQCVTLRQRKDMLSAAQRVTLPKSWIRRHGTHTRKLVLQPEVKVVLL